MSVTEVMKLENPIRCRLFKPTSEDIYKRIKEILSEINSIIIKIQTEFRGDLFYSYIDSLEDAFVKSDITNPDSGIPIKTLENGELIIDFKELKKHENYVNRVNLVLRVIKCLSNDLLIEKLKELINLFDELSKNSDNKFYFNIKNMKNKVKMIETLRAYVNNNDNIIIKARTQEALKSKIRQLFTTMKYVYNNYIEICKIYTLIENNEKMKVTCKSKIKRELLHLESNIKNQDISHLINIVISKLLEIIHFLKEIFTKNFLKEETIA